MNTYNLYLGMLLTLMGLFGITHTPLSGLFLGGMGVFFMYAPLRDIMNLKDIEEKQAKLKKFAITTGSLCIFAGLCAISTEIFMGQGIFFLCLGMCCMIVPIKGNREKRKREQAEQKRIEQEQAELEEKYSSACMRMSEICTPADAVEVRELFMQISTYKDAAQKSDECRTLETGLREKDKKYETANRMLNRQRISLADIDSVIATFTELLEYRDSALLINDAYTKRATIIEKMYADACKKMNRAHVLSSVQEAMHIFEQIPDYSDVGDLINKCRQLIVDLERQESISVKAVALMNKASTIAEIDEAIALFKSIPSYNQTQKHIEECKKKAQSIRKSIFDDATRKLAGARTSADVEAAIALFKSIENYPNVKTQIAKCEERKRELDAKEVTYQNAYAKYRKAKTVSDFEEVIAAFSSITDYRDAKNLIEASKAAIHEIQRKIDAPYQEACKALTDAKVAEDARIAYEKFAKLKGYKDSKQKAEQCLRLEKEYQAKEKKYQEAHSKFNEAKTIEDFDEVGKLFSALSGYRDSDTLCETCKTKIKRIKEIEEKKRKEAAERARIEAEKKAQISSIETAMTAPDNIEITQSKIVPENRKALNLILENPFRVLGLSRNASTEDAQSVLDKFKKLERLKALGSYSSPFHLKHFSKPDRSAAVVQAAIGTLNEAKNRILWFATSAGSNAWITSEYREMSNQLPGIEYDKYDVFLANYVFAILNDPLFANKTLWVKVFKLMAGFIKQGNGAASLFAGENTDESFGALFEKQVSQPIVAMIEDAEISSLKNLYVIIKGMDELETISKKLDSRLSKWFETETHAIDKQISELGDGENAPASKTATAKRLYAELKKKVKPELTWAESNYPAKSVRLTMFQDEYRGTAWSIMGFLFKAGSKADARSIADDIEQYCNDEQKDILKFVIREVPRPRPKPVPPPHDTYDLGWQSPPYTYDDILIVEVDLGNIANVYLMEDSDYQDYLACRPFSYYGGCQTQTPVRIKIPSFGHWYVVIDNDGDSVAGLYSACRTRVI